MKVTIKKMKLHDTKEYMLRVNGITIAFCAVKADAKFLAKCVRKYKGKDRRYE